MNIKDRKGFAYIFYDIRLFGACLLSSHSQFYRIYGYLAIGYPLILYIFFPSKEKMRILFLIFQIRFGNMFSSIFIEKTFYFLAFCFLYIFFSIFSICGDILFVRFDPPFSLYSIFIYFSFF